MISGPFLSLIYHPHWLKAVGGTFMAMMLLSTGEGVKWPAFSGVTCPIYCSKKRWWCHKLKRGWITCVSDIKILIVDSPVSLTEKFWCHTVSVSFIAVKDWKLDGKHDIYVSDIDGACSSVYGVLKKKGAEGTEFTVFVWCCQQVQLMYKAVDVNQQIFCKKRGVSH